MSQKRATCSLCAILGLTFSFREKLWGFDDLVNEFSLFLRPQFICFTFYFLTISQYPFQPLVLCSTEMFNPISSSLHLPLAVARRGVENLIALVFFCPVPIHFFTQFHSVGGIKDDDLLLKYHNVFVSDLSELFDLVESL